MRFFTLLREAVMSSKAAKVPTALIALVAATMCAITLATVGKTAANQAQVKAQLEAIGARQLTITDSRSSDAITPSTLKQIESISSIESATVMGMPVDAVNGALGNGGTKVALFPMLGNIDLAAKLTWGRMPQPGEALVTASAMQKLGLDAPVGYVVTSEGKNFPIVGQFAPTAGFENLQDAILLSAPPGSPGRQLRVIIRTVPEVAATENAVFQVLGPAVKEMQVESPNQLAQVAETLGKQLASFSQSLLTLVLGVGAFFTAAVVLADVLIRRRDLGRRRTLGISRPALTALVVTRTSIAALIGTIIGTGGAMAVNQASGVATPIRFAVAVAILALITACLASVPPAIFAATRDPVRVMRTP